MDCLLIYFSFRKKKKEREPNDESRSLRSKFPEIFMKTIFQAFMQGLKGIYSYSHWRSHEPSDSHWPATNQYQRAHSRTRSVPWQSGRVGLPCEVALTLCSADIRHTECTKNTNLKSLRTIYYNPDTPHTLHTTTVSRLQLCCQYTVSIQGGTTQGCHCRTPSPSGPTLLRSQHFTCLPDF